MAGRPGIAYESVRDFIEEHVRDNGSLPSIAAIVAACGGSATTITRFRRRYISETQGVARDVPEALEASIAAGARTLWSELVEALAVGEQQLEAAFETRRQEADARVEAAHGKAVEARQETRETRAVLEEAHTALTEERRTSATLLDRLTATERTLSDATGNVRALTTRLAECEAALERNATDFEARLAAARAAAAQLERQADARVAALEEGWNRTAAEHQERTATLTEEITEGKRMLALERHAAAECREALTESEQRYVAVSTQRAHAEQRVEVVTEELAVSARECRQLRDTLETTVAELAAAKATIKGLERAGRAAHRELDARDQELEALRQSNGGLLEALAQLKGD